MLNIVVNIITSKEYFQFVENTPKKTIKFTSLFNSVVVMISDFFFRFHASVSTIKVSRYMTNWFHRQSLFCHIFSIWVGFLFR